MPVRLITYPAGTDDDGTEAVAFGFAYDSTEGGHVDGTTTCGSSATAMTKFGRYPDSDILDLAAEASARRARRRRRDHARHAGPGRREASSSRTPCRPADAEADRPDRHPRLQRANACATGATAVRTVLLAIKAGEADMGLAVGVEQMGKAGLLGVPVEPGRPGKVFEPDGPLRSGHRRPRACSAPA